MNVEMSRQLNSAVYNAFVPRVIDLRISLTLG